MLLFFAELRRFQQGQEVVLYGQLTEDRCFLRQIADAVGRPLVDGKLSNIVSVNRDFAGCRPLDADNHVEGRRLPRPVRAEETYDFSLVDTNADTVDGISFFIRFYEIFGLNEHGYPLLTARHDDDGRAAASLNRIIGKLNIDIIPI